MGRPSLARQIARCRSVAVVRPKAFGLVSKDSREMLDFGRCPDHRDEYFAALALDAARDASDMALASGEWDANRRPYTSHS